MWRSIYPPSCQIFSLSRVDSALCTSGWSYQPLILESFDYKQWFMKVSDKRNGHFPASVQNNIPYFIYFRIDSVNEKTKPFSFHWNITFFSWLVKASCYHFSFLGVSGDRFRSLQPSSLCGCPWHGGLCEAFFQGWRGDGLLNFLGYTTFA